MIGMKTNYQMALDLVRQSMDVADIEAAQLMVAQAQVYATLALTERGA
jgi:hypothetical protein